MIIRDDEGAGIITRDMRRAGDIFARPGRVSAAVTTAEGLWLIVPYDGVTTHWPADDSHPQAWPTHAAERLDVGRDLVLTVTWGGEEIALCGGPIQRVLLEVHTRGQA